jgi:hypothetical protein
MWSRKDRQGFALIGGVCLVVAGIFVFMAVSAKKPKAAADNCIGEPVASTVVLLDHSDAMSAQTRDEVLARASAHIRDKVQVNERVTVFTVSDLSRKALRPLVSLCRPPAEGSRLTENVKVIEKRFQERFVAPLREALSAGPTGAKESAIAQALTDISLSRYLRSPQNSLLVFSDMYEHTDKFSLYKCASPDGVIARYRDSRRGAQERPKFRNTSVFINVIPRPQPSQQVLKCRDKLWPWFFGNNEGASAGLTIDYLPGGI